MADTATTEIEVETPPAEGSSQAEPKDEFVAQLSKIYKRLKFSKKLKSAMKEVEQELLDLLGVRLFTIYQSVAQVAPAWPTQSTGARRVTPDGERQDVRSLSMSLPARWCRSRGPD